MRLHMHKSAPITIEIRSPETIGVVRADDADANGNGRLLPSTLGHLRAIIPSFSAVGFRLYPQTPEGALNCGNVSWSVKHLKTILD